VSDPPAAKPAAERADGPGPNKPSRWRAHAPRVLIVLSVLVACVAAVSVRVILAGEAEIAASTQALQQADSRAAIEHAGRAAGWYAPGAPHVSVAYGRLKAIARAAEQHRRREVALLAWRRLRSAAIETRWVVTPHRVDLELANGEIARLMATGPHPSAAPDGRIAAAQLQALSRRAGPQLPWVVVLIGGFILWWLGLLLWSRQVSQPGGKLGWAAGRSGAMLTAAGVALWLLAVWQA